MQSFPHHYRVGSQATFDGNVVLSSEGLGDILSTAPTEFGGSGHEWSPEGLLVAAVADCFILSFKALAKASKFDWEQIGCKAIGTLDRVERETRFTHFELTATLKIAADGKPDLAEQLLNKAKKICLITNSLKAECTLNYDVQVS